jgi:hypothetical protein
LIGFLFSFAQSNSKFLNSQGFSGLFVPDAVNLRDSILLIIEQKKFLLENYINSGVYIIYVPAALLGSWLYLFINSTMLCLGLFYFTKIFEFYKINETSRVKSILIASFAVVINPYLISVVGFPNKEVPLILLTNMYMYYALSNTKKYLLLLLSLVVFFFRDGYGLILFLCSFWILFLGKINFKYKYLISILTMLLAFNFFKLDDFTFFGLPVQRILNIFSSSSFYYKLVGNIINLGFRPQFFDINGLLFLISIGYWMLGVCIISGFIWSITNITNKIESKAKISFVVILIILSISFSSYIQPRYLMPLIMFLTIGLRSKVGFIGLLLCILFPIIFYLTDSLPELMHDYIFE